MKRVGFFVVAFALLGAKSPAEGEPLATQRHVAGVITAMSDSALTVASTQRSVTGKIDPSRTKVTVHGHPASLSALKLTAHVRGELCLDEVWLTIDTH